MHKSGLFLVLDVFTEEDNEVGLKVLPIVKRVSAMWQKILALEMVSTNHVVGTCASVAEAANHWVEEIKVSPNPKQKSKHNRHHIYYITIIL